MSDAIVAPPDNKRVFRYTNPEETKGQVAAVLESGLPDDIKVRILKTLNSHEKSLRDSALLTHIVGSLITQYAQDGEGEVVITQDALKIYFTEVKAHKVFPEIEYHETSDELGHSVKLVWPKLATQ